ncbi:hypothetical protein FB480_11655 [Agrobacterium vitis]|nr:hypothetical protein FB480_11655 [Agrobacterium vitis]
MRFCLLLFIFCLAKRRVQSVEMGGYIIAKFDSVFCL